MSLVKIQAELKAPKNQYNSFGKYHYRNAEDILEALKPLLLSNNATLVLKDEVECIGNRYYVKATCVLVIGETTITTTGYAREEETKKGMDASQITGACSSYARKYALNAMFLIDDTKDADATNTHEKAPELKEEDRMYLMTLLETSSYNEEVKQKMAIKISAFTKKSEYQIAYENLIANQETQTK